MTENQELGLRKVARALISVSDKTGIVDFARQLKTFDVEIISTGGTAKVLREAGIDVRDVSDVTGFPEMMDGRVKTLHPKIHGGLLGVRDNPEHQAAMREHGIEPIDMVVVNLYPFEETDRARGRYTRRSNRTNRYRRPGDDSIGGEEFRDVAVVVYPESYDSIVAELTSSIMGHWLVDGGALCPLGFFSNTAAYDSAIFTYLGSMRAEAQQRQRVDIEHYDHDLSHLLSSFDESMQVSLLKMNDLRYGENPHQRAALYFLSKPSGDEQGVALAELLNGKEMSFNNYVDADAAWQLVSDFDELACAIIKHTNPAGVALGESAEGGLSSRVSDRSDLSVRRHRCFQSHG